MASSPPEKRCRWSARQLTPTVKSRPPLDPLKTPSRPPQDPLKTPSRPPLIDHLHQHIAHATRANITKS
eukprot:1194972-Prorocentrum_minimum.AAC.1